MNILSIFTSIKKMSINETTINQLNILRKIVIIQLNS